MGVVGAVKYGLLKTLLAFFYVVSHVYDYLSYPVYLVAYHPWRVRRYKRSNHASRTDCAEDSTIVYSSLVEPSEINRDIDANGLDTMDKMFDYLTTKHGDKECLGTREILSEEDERQPNGKTFKKYILGRYNWQTFSDFKQRGEECAAGLDGLGVRSGDRVAILAETRAEWLMAAYGCFLSNVTIVTLYTNLGDEGVRHALNETEVEVLFCSAETAAKASVVLPSCQSVKTVVVMESLSPGKKSYDIKGVDRIVMFQNFLKNSTGKDGSTNRPRPEDVAIVMYTSGSTGQPKGVMLSHGNLVSAMSALMNIAKFRPNDRYIAYLPLAHVLELLAEASCLMHGIKIGYSSAGTLTNKSSKVKAGSKGDANVLRPTLMCAVPMILERIYKSVVDTMRRQGWVAEELFHYFVRYKMKWQDRGFDTPLLNKTLFRKIRYFLGGRVRLMLSGGAPLSPDTHSLTRTCICVPVIQGYGLTETTACAAVTSRYDRVTGRAGAPLMNVKIKLVDWSEGGYTTKDKPFPRGEIHVGGDNVATGYFRNPKKTAEDFYEDSDRIRWFRTGDIGEVHDDGVIKIVDRKKDLVKLQQGEYVSYGKVESVLKTCPIVENICVYADPEKDYLVAIVIPDRTHLSEVTELIAKEAVEDEAVNGKIVSLVAEYGRKQGLEKFEIPSKLVLTADEWTPDSGLVTAAFKIRRRQIVDKYRRQIDQIYT